ncbi:MAG: hypothetical protein OXH27_02710 [Gammaproteobacteria bacterium]|nr:hypothetical protein [Gammaproteobacteria bacterium]
MFAGSDRLPLRWLRALALGLLAPALSVHGQETSADAERALISFSIAPASMPDEAGGLIKVVRTAETQDLRNGLVEDALNYSLGLQTSPVEGLKLDANLWRSQFDAAPLQNSSVPQPNLRSSGFDVGAAYAWNTNRFGQFTLSTRASYVQDFYNTEGLLEAVNNNLPSAKLTTPDLRSNLKLSWEFGNHTATAITRYFDSSRDLSELGMEEINDLVDNITTVDLEYGYRMAAGSNDRAVISFGIQNVFDRKTMQILNSATRVLDQNGRVAYGRLKYQF